MTDIIERLERAYDAIPREGGADVEAVGPFELFLRKPPGWPYYARPRIGETHFTTADVENVLARQRELGVPQAIEWVHDATAELLAAVRGTDLPVIEAPLMVLDPDRLPALPADGLVLLDPDSADFADLFSTSGAVAHLGFGAAGTAIGSAGPAERDARPAAEPALVERIATGLRSGRTAEAVLTVPGQGVVARAGRQGALGAAEIVGVATLPSARRQGYGGAVSAFLARQALDSGYDTVFLSAVNDDVARVYGTIGFTRVGTACIAEP